jgi:type II secretory pathway component GspD/PulD (secretin)
MARVPFLARLPVVGALFRNRARSTRRSELLVFITPTVVDGPPLPRFDRVRETHEGRDAAPRDSTKHAVSS